MPRSETTDLLAAVTPLPGSAASAVAWRQRGQLHVTVIVKATYAFAPDDDMPQIEPEEVIRAEVHHGKSPARSVRLTSDTSPYLARADVLFTGHAHAPEGSTVHTQPVRLAVRRADRSVLDKVLLATDKRGFQRLPLVFERAFTGLDRRDNPFGVGADEATVIDPVEPSRPACYGPIARAWPARKRLLGTTPRAVLEGPIAEIPERFDWAYFQAAPPDQQIERLLGDEWILLEGLHPEAPRIWTRLPGARAGARIHGLSSFGVPEGHPLELQADTLRIEGDEERCSVVWRQSIAIPDEAALAAVRIVAGVLPAGESIDWPEPPPRAAVDEIEVDVVDLTTGDMTLVADEEEGEEPTRRYVLPFAAPAATETIVLAPQDDAEASARPALPFHQRAGRKRLATLAITEDLPRGPVLPFATVTLDLEVPQAPPLPFREPRPAPSPDNAPTAKLPAVVLPETPARHAPPPPPASSPRTFEPVLVPAAPSSAAGRAPPSAPAADAPIDLETFAAVAAELGELRAPRGEVLGGRGIAEARWTEAEKRWTEALAAEAKRGERKLLDAHDDAFFKAWQGVRGPFEFADYAQLTVAAERNDLAGGLDAMGIRRTVWMRLKRIFARNIATDRAFAAGVKQALADQRARAPAKRR